MRTEQLLESAFQLAITDLEENSPAPDPLRFAEYDHDKAGLLRWIRKHLALGTYRPAPLLSIDFPKSEFAYRPATRIEVRDLIVLFYVLLQISDRLERQLGPEAASHRLKVDKKTGSLRIIRGSTYILPRHLRRRFGITVPWYDAWPKFRKSLERAYRSGSKNVGATDITGFFEHIDHEILRRNLMQLGGRGNVQLINLLVEIYSAWGLRDIQNVRQGRGLPQGTDVSGVIANYYLARQDRVIARAAKRNRVRWYRYCDDMYFLGKDYAKVREILLLVGDWLKRHRLVQNSAKTKILTGREVKQALFDPRADKMKTAINLLRKGKVTRTAAVMLRNLPRSSGPFTKQDSQVLAMLYAYYTVAKRPAMLNRAFEDLEHQPTRTKTICAYLRLWADRGWVKRNIFTLLSDKRYPLTSFQKAQLIRLARACPHLDSKKLDLLQKIAHTKKENWYVRQQAIVTLLHFFDDVRLKGFVRLLRTEWDEEVKRACLVCTAVLPRDKRTKILEAFARSVEPKLSRMANFLLDLSTKPALMDHHLRKFRVYNEMFWSESFWRLAFIDRHATSQLNTMYESVMKKTLTETKSKQVRKHVQLLTAA
jgi:hypothetical protein